MRRHSYRYLLILFLVLTGCQDSGVAPQQSLTLEEEQLLLGNPSGATAGKGNPNNYLLSEVPLQVQEALEGRVDTGPTQ